MTAPADHAATVPDVLSALSVLREELAGIELERSAMAISRASHLIVALADRASELEDRIEELEARWRQHMNFCTRPPA